VFHTLVNHPLTPRFAVKRGTGRVEELVVNRLAEGWTVQVSIDRGRTWNDYWVVREGQKRIETGIVSGALFRLVRSD
jgi:hypothetical protein